MTPSTTLTSVKDPSGTVFDVISAEGYEYNGNSRVQYICKRPRGKLLYVVFGYENGSFSSAVRL